VQGARRAGLGVGTRTWPLAALAALAAVLGIRVGPAQAAPPPPPELAARAWTLVDADDGAVLASHRPARSYPVASTTKLMTALVARKDLRLGEAVTAPPYNPIPGESLLGLRAGEMIDVRDLLYGMLLVSGNDAAEALSQAAAGSERAFVAEMNRAARRLDLEDTSYANPIGLDEAGNFSSARDLVQLAIVLRRDRLFRRIFDSPDAVLRSGARVRSVVNRNTLVRTVPYVNGVKTGHTLGADYVLVASARRRGVELVSSVLGAPSELERDAEARALLDYGFSLYHRRSAFERGERLAAPALRYQDDRVALAPTHAVRLTVRDGQRLRTRVHAPGEVEGPIDRGERFGRAIVWLDGERIASVPLAAVRSAPGATWLERYDAAIPGSRAVAWALAAAALALLVGLAMVLLRRLRS
jgi:serine-type D-Ala-D-Ala carboxypeptidase (penicillin-binding protein 5/6)